MAPVTHIVALKIAADQKAVAQSLTTGFFDLKDSCVGAAAEGKPYILSVKGGRDVSIEGLQKGFSHAFVLEFASADDRDYYVTKDPAHAAFAKQIVEAVGFEGVIVLDFMG